MEQIKHKSCNNKVKLIIIPTYSITNSMVNSTLTIKIQQINYNNYANTTIKNIQKIKKKLYTLAMNKKKKLQTLSTLQKNTPKQKK